MELDRRTLLRTALIGGAVAGTGALAACSTGASGTSSSASASALPAAALSANELAPLQLFASAGFNDEALFALGGASSQTSEVGEVLRISQSINAITGNPTEPTTETFNAYYQGFGDFGDGLQTLAEQAGPAHPVTARDRHMRAATYAAQQLFFVLGTSDGTREEAIFRTAQSRWLAAVRSFTPAVEQFKVKSKFGVLPGYFFRAPGGGAKPTVIISEGSDGQNVETMQFGVTAGLARGYNVVLFEGPGQMSLLFEKGLPFTPNWNEVVGPVLDWTRAQPDVGKIALIGISFGGMLCARAAAKLTKLDAVVLEPAAWSFPKMWGDQKSMQAVQETSGAPAPEKAAVAKEVNEGFLQAWGQMSRTSQFVIYKRGEIVSPQVQQEAREGKPISNYYGLLAAILPFTYEADYRAITIPTMLTSNEGDEFFAEQSAEAFAMLDKVPASRKVLQKFTAAQGAALHDQPTGPQVAQEYVFDWLDDQLR